MNALYTTNNAVSHHKQSVHLTFDISTSKGKGGERREGEGRKGRGGTQPCLTFSLIYATPL